MLSSLIGIILIALFVFAIASMIYVRWQSKRMWSDIPQNGDATASAKNIPDSPVNPAQRELENKSRVDAGFSRLVWLGIIQGIISFANLITQGEVTGIILAGSIPIGMIILIWLIIKYRLWTGKLVMALAAFLLLSYGVGFTRLYFPDTPAARAVERVNLSQAIAISVDSVNNVTTLVTESLPQKSPEEKALDLAESWADDNEHLVEQVKERQQKTYDRLKGAQRHSSSGWAFKDVKKTKVRWTYNLDSSTTNKYTATAKIDCNVELHVEVYTTQVHDYSCSRSYLLAIDVENETVSEIPR